MKAKVIKTGEIIDVQCLYPITYSRLDCNGKIFEEYDADEIELIPNPNAPKMVSLDKVCEFLKKFKCQKYPHGDVKNLINDDIIEHLRKEFE